MIIWFAGGSSDSPPAQLSQMWPDPRAQASVSRKLFIVVVVVAEPPCRGVCTRNSPQAVLLNDICCVRWQIWVWSLFVCTSPWSTWLSNVHCNSWDYWDYFGNYLGLFCQIGLDTANLPATCNSAKKSHVKNHLSIHVSFFLWFYKSQNQLV